MGCLDADTVVDLVEGRLSTTARAAAEAHVAGCADCRQVVAAAVRDSADPDADAAPLAATVADDAAAAPATLGRGATIGRYVLLEPHGRGGMGDVYRAFDPELERTIALKLVRPSHQGEAARVRLIREARALAQLAHPNVVAVHDAGSVGDQVFIAMEFVTGKTLRRWLRDERPPRRRVVEALVAAGRGLDAAHRAGLVHRDFKPDNVIVGDDGRVRVLDFGLARAEAAPVTTPGAPAPASRSPSLGTLTRTGAVAGTPAYMAPEQHAGGDVDARTDQFAFAVTLYEALTGQRPFPDDDPRPAIAAGRIAAPPRERPVPTWLRRIVARAVAAAPAARYPTMAALLVDLERRATIRRRRIAAVGGGTAVAVVAAAAITAGMTGGGPTAPPPCQFTDAPLAGRWDATRRAALAASFAAADPRRGAATFARAATALDAYAAAWTTMRHDACVATRVRGDQSEDVLDVRMLCLERRRRELGEVVDLLAHADAAGVGAAVDVATALPPVADCADVATLTAPLPLPRDPALRAAVEGLHAEIARVDALRITRQLEPGLAAARALVEHARNVAYPPVQAEAIYYGALMHGMASQLDDAERLAEEALYLAIAARHTGVVVRAANELIWDLGIAGERRDEAERWARLASAALASLGGDDELEALLESTLGTLALYESKNDDALAHLERALALERELAGDDSPHVGRSLANLAILYFNRGDLAKSGELLREAHAIYVRTYGDDSPTLIEIEQNLAVLEVELGELDAAAAHATHAYELAVATYGELSAEAAAGLAPLISVHELQGDLVRAEGEARRRIAALEHVHGPDAGIVGSALVALADVEADRGALDAALADNQRALDLFARAFGRDGEDGRDAGLAWVARSVILVRARRPGEAVDAAARGHRIARRLVGDDSTVTGDALVKLGVAEVLAGRRRDGLAHLADGVAVLTRLGAPAPQRGEAEQALASALWVDDPAGARAHAARARDAFRDAGASAAHDLAEVEAWLAAHPP